MKLIKVRILNYRSIERPIEIDVSDNKLIAFIGKNGCGKTNLLKALKLALSKQNNYVGRHENDKLSAEYIYRLTDKENEEFFSIFDLQSRENYITIAFNGEEPQIRKIKAPIVKVCIKNFKHELSNIQTEFKQAALNYIDNLRIIEAEEMYDIVNYYDVKIKNEEGQIWGLRKSYVDQIERNLESHAKAIEELFAQFSDDWFSISQYGTRSYIGTFHSHIQFYEITEQKLAFSPIIIKALGLKGEDIVKANEKLNITIQAINEQLKESYQKLQQQISKFEQLKKDIEKVFSRKEDELYIAEEERNKKQSHFLQLLKETAFGDGYYLDNEDCLLFYSGQEQEYYRGQKQEAYLNFRNPIIEAFDWFLKNKSYYKDDESIINFNKIDENRQHVLVKILNEQFLKNIIPEFDKDEVKKYILKLEQRKLVLNIVEQDNKEISVNETSLGRRWYLTFKFVRQLLKKGNYLFIDEPAAFLHPKAQLEIKFELEKLRKKGIYVFIATHSPYMIPANWENIISLNNTENGTTAKYFCSGGELSEEIQNELGVLHTSDVLFNLSETILLVEGVADKACVEKFAELLHYDLSAYYIHVCDGDSIVQMSYLCIKNVIKFLAIADNDNRFKDKNYKSSHPNFNKCLQAMINKPDKCFFVGDGKTGCLEDYFSKEGHKFHYLETKNNKWKIARGQIKKIRNCSELQQETIENFEQMFSQLGIPKLDDTKA